MLVLLANISPLTLWGVSTKGLFLLRAIWMEEGPQSMKLASFFSLTLCSDLWIWVASTSPWMMLRMDIYLPFLVGALTMMLLGCSSLLITSSTVVFFMFEVCFSTVRGVYPVMRKWHLGVGIKEANSPTISLFMQLGQRRVVVEAAITVDTSELTWLKLGLWILSLSEAILFRAVLSNTTTESELLTSLLRVSMELQGWTTTSETSCWLGKTEQVEMIFLEYLSLSFSRRKLPSPLPVPPAMEWRMTKPSRDSDPSASLSIMSMISS